MDSGGAVGLIQGQEKPCGARVLAETGVGAGEVGLNRFSVSCVFSISRTGGLQKEARWGS